MLLNILSKAMLDMMLVLESYFCDRYSGFDQIRAYFTSINGCTKQAIEVSDSSESLVEIGLQKAQC